MHRQLLFLANIGLQKFGRAIAGSVVAVIAEQGRLLGIWAQLMFPLLMEKRHPLLARGITPGRAADDRHNAVMTRTQVNAIPVRQ